MSKNTSKSNTRKHQHRSLKSFKFPVGTHVEYILKDRVLYTGVVAGLVTDKARKPYIVYTLGAVIYAHEKFLRQV